MQNNKIQSRNIDIDTLFDITRKVLVDEVFIKKHFKKMVLSQNLN